MADTKNPKGMVYVDSSNFFHSLRRIGLSMYHIDFRRLAQMLLMGRELVEIRYYAAPLDQAAVPKLYASQQRYWANLRKAGVKLKLGYMQDNFFECKKCGKKRQGIVCPECKYEFAKVTEKGVDVHIAADLVYHASLSKFDWAYLNSSDGDLAGACERVRMLGKKVVYVCVPPIESTALKTACNYTATKDATFFSGVHIADR
ncbi:MAG: NYN domain-containing protein [Acidobacteria bacterium]|nr:NYN domain-containing protein [Acidobacteriota bacterium]